jgi:hypothetical protein
MSVLRHVVHGQTVTITSKFGTITNTSTSSVFIFLFADVSAISRRSKIISWSGYSVITPQWLLITPYESHANRIQYIRFIATPWNSIGRSVCHNGLLTCENDLEGWRAIHPGTSCWQKKKYNFTVIKHSDYRPALGAVLMSLCNTLSDERMGLSLRNMLGLS